MIRETTTFDDERMIVTRTEDVQSILDGNQLIARETQHHRGDFRMVGRIPPTVMEQWMKECGAGLGSHELMAYIKKKLQDGDFARLCVHGY